jgi:hypothetical protein
MGAMRRKRPFVEIEYATDTTPADLGIERFAIAVAVKVALGAMPRTEYRSS